MSYILYLLDICWKTFTAIKPAKHKYGGASYQAFIHYCCRLLWSLWMPFLPLDGSKHSNENLRIIVTDRKDWQIFCTYAENNWTLHSVCCLFDTFCIAGPGYLTDFVKMRGHYTVAVMVAWLTKHLTFQDLKFSQTTHNF